MAREFDKSDLQKFVNKETGLVVVSLNKRYQNVNAGETAGYPIDEALKLCNMEVNLGKDKYGPAAVPVEPKHEQKK